MQTISLNAIHLLYTQVPESVLKVAEDIGEVVDTLGRTIIEVSVHQLSTAIHERFDLIQTEDEDLVQYTTQLQNFDDTILIILEILH